MNRIVLQMTAILLLAGIPAVMSAFLHPQRPPFDTALVRTEKVNIGTALAWGDHVLWIDARSQEEFDQQHIPDAIALSEDNWQRQIDIFLEQWDYDRRVVVYCNSDACNASKTVALRLKQEMDGLEQIYVLKGGWQAWQDSKQ